MFRDLLYLWAPLRAWSIKCWTFRQFPAAGLDFEPASATASSSGTPVPMNLGGQVSSYLADWGLRGVSSPPSAGGMSADAGSGPRQQCEGSGWAAPGGSRLTSSG